MTDQAVLDDKAGPMSNARIDLARPIYPLALSVLRLNVAPAALVLAVLILLSMVQSFTGPSMALAPLRLACMVMFAHAAYRVLLTSGRVHGCIAFADPAGRAPLRFLGTMVMIFMPMVLIGAVWTTDGGPELLGPRVFIGAILLMVISYGVLLVLMGTALPELADTGRTDPGAALRRGFSSYRTIARGLLFGPGLFGVAHGLVLVAVDYLGLPQGAYDAETGTFLPGALAVLSVILLGNLYSVTLAAVVLTRAYRNAGASAG